MSTPWWIWPAGYAGLIVLSFVWTKLRAPGFDVKDKHVFITGGSSGLGLSFAIKCAKRGAKVSIVARSQEKLEAAKREIETAASKGHVFIQSTDVTSFDSVTNAIAAANKFHNQPTDKLVCCAGLAAPGLMMDQDISVYHKMMDLNYFGVVNTVKAALPAMIEAQNKGHVIIIASAVSLMSFVGYTQYASSKYAVRGFAEALRNELKLYDMQTTVFYPGNIDSPGFVAENRTKPAVTYEIEGASTPVHPDSVADSLLSGLADGHFAITNDPLLFVLRVISNGVAPRFNSPLEVLMFPLAVIIQMGFGVYMDYLVTQSGKKMAAKPKTT